MSALNSATSLNTSPTTGPATSPAIDLRTLAPRDRHRVVFGHTDALPLGQSLQLISDHAPQPLRYQLDDRAFGQFDWAALESGPIAWRVQITRVAAKPDQAASGSCCSSGACGG